MKSKKWECKHGCDQAAYIKATGGYCPHLERLIDAPTGGSRELAVADIRDASSDNPEAAIENYLALLRREDEEDDGLAEDERLLGVLTRLGLTRKKADVLVMRICRGLSFKEIAVELGYARAQGARQAHQDAIKWLKEKAEGK